MKTTKLIIIITLGAILILNGCILAEIECQNNEYLKKYDIVKGGTLATSELLGHGLTGEQIVEIRDYCSKK